MRLVEVDVETTVGLVDETLREGRQNFFCEDAKFDK